MSKMRTVISSRALLYLCLSVIVLIGVRSADSFEETKIPLPDESKYGFLYNYVCMMRYNSIAILIRHGILSTKTNKWS